MSLLVIYNPASGDRSAKQFFEEHVIPLLHQHDKNPTNIASTERAGHAGELVKSHIAAHPGPVTVIIGSGDGTVHEIVNGLPEAAATRVDLVIVPLGTANALYSSLFPPSGADQDPTSYRLKGLSAFLTSAPPKPLTLAKTTLSPSSTVYSAVVTSTALHASILHDSEALRASMPGIDRFKAAAAQNITRWYRASVTLHPPISIYDPTAAALTPRAQEPTTLHGPFAYFLSTVNVDRLEPLFRITPLAASLPPTAPALDLVVVRPLRDPAVSSDSADDREVFAQKAGRVLGEAYNSGNHVNLRYAPDRQPVTEGDGETVVEYFRCASFEWVPEGADDRAHLLCADGAIFNIAQSGKASCVATSSTDNGITFSVYA